MILSTHDEKTHHSESKVNNKFLEDIQSQLHALKNKEDL